MFLYKCFRDYFVICFHVIFYYLMDHAVLKLSTDTSLSLLFPYVIFALNIVISTYTQMAFFSRSHSKSRNEIFPRISTEMRWAVKKVTNKIRRAQDRLHYRLAKNTLGKIRINKIKYML